MKLVSCNCNSLRILIASNCLSISNVNFISKLMLKDAWRYNYLQTQYSVHTNGNSTVQLKFHTFALKLFANGFIISGQCRVI